MRKILIIFLLLLIILSCSKTDNTISKKNRFVVTSPELAELLYLINAHHDVVGVTMECDYPDFYKKIPKVGNFGNVNIEKILKLKPSVVFTTKLEQNKLNDTLSKLKIQTVSIYPKNTDDFLNSILKLGQITGRAKRAMFVADSLKRELTQFKENYKDKANKPKVYVEIYNNPVMSASSESFLGKLIEYAGGQNIFDKLPRDYSQVNQEEIIKKNPDVIICLVPGETKERITKRKGWKEIKAVKQGRIYTTQDVNPDLVLRAGSRVIEGIKSLNKVIYEKN